jgi:hypothetical protein
MIRFKFVRSAALVLSALVALSCSDQSPTGPIVPETTEDGLLTGLVGGGIVNPVVRVIGFASDPAGIDVTGVRWAPSHVSRVRSVSAIIGPAGGILTILGSDFGIVFPAGAVLVPTAITITSDASGYVSYDMQPHGLSFARPVTVTQGLSNTAVYGTPAALTVFGAYFPQDLFDLTGLLKALEIELTTIYSGPSGRAEAETWKLNHFSRYMLSSG